MAQAQMSKSQARKRTETDEPQVTGKGLHARRVEWPDDIVGEINAVLTQHEALVGGYFNGTVSEDFSKLNLAFDQYMRDQIDPSQYEMFRQAWLSKWRGKYALDCDGYYPSA